jgi:hypothetical protein
VPIFTCPVLPVRYLSQAVQGSRFLHGSDGYVLMPFPATVPTSSQPFWRSGAILEIGMALPLHEGAHSRTAAPSLSHARQPSFCSPDIIRYAARPYQATWLHHVTAFSTAGRASAGALLVKAKKRLVGLLLVYTGANALIQVGVLG